MEGWRNPAGATAVLVFLFGRMQRDPFRLGTDLAYAKQTLAPRYRVLQIQSAISRDALCIPSREQPHDLVEYVAPLIPSSKSGAHDVAPWTDTGNRGAADTVSTAKS